MWEKFSFWNKTEFEEREIVKKKKSLGNVEETKARKRKNKKEISIAVSWRNGNKKGKDGRKKKIVSARKKKVIVEETEIRKGKMEERKIKLLVQERKKS